MNPLADDDPRRIGPYRIVARLGSGGMGRVYLGRSPGGRNVAVKVVRPDLAEDEDFRTRFRREVADARRVGGEWTAPVLDADTEGERPWLATRYVPGPSLSQAVRHAGPFPERSVRLLGAGLAEALRAVHGAGLVHRDLKPSNVLLDVDRPRLIDFGISRAADASVLTRTGLPLGSPGYMSPEQINNQRDLPVGPPSDVFSLGAVLVHAATGVGAFGQGPPEVLLVRAITDQPRLDDVSEALRPLVRRCLTKEPADRPTVEELLDALPPRGEGVRTLTRGGWLPPAVAEMISRRAAEILDFEAADEPPAPSAPPAPLVPPAPPVLSAPPAPSGPPVPPPPPVRNAEGGTAPSSRPDGGHPPTIGAATAPAPAPTRPGTRRRRWTPVAVAAAAALAAGLAGARFLGDGGQRGGDADPTPTPTAERVSGERLPEEYVGTWTGTVQSDLGVRGEVTMTIREGAVGDVVYEAGNRASYLGVDLDLVCAGVGTLVEVEEGSVVVEGTELTAGTADFCVVGERVRLSAREDGTLRYESLSDAAGTPEGTLTRQR
ncbi:serine/threonine-protein kinase [Allostreptomyces psammosilenae]|uniref:Serine/threonine protein kinase n=1 Tax=Allostreptomyces psammosilenae TaxID=1892865 RepID=A0A853ADF5_9ACTN|nr:serine/threonine-protein kinase [Allostreptomyces psammosilenae]NYI08362.1 serine/threonine protein kinase [Allostreptomyces psammosilenae]